MARFDRARHSLPLTEKPLPRDAAISRLLVVSNRALRREMDLLDRQVEDAVGRSLSYEFLQDRGDLGCVWRALGSDGFPQVYYDAGFAAFACEEMRNQIGAAGAFKAYRPSDFGYDADPLLEPLLAIDPRFGITVSGAVPYIMWVDERLLQGRPVPASWEDVLDPMWEGDVTVDNLRFARDNPVCIAYYRLYGKAGLDALLKSIPSSTSNVVGTINVESNQVAIHIGVLPFIRCCDGLPYIRLVQPREGAIVAPLLLLARSELDVDGSAVLSYLLGPRWAAISARNGLPSVTAVHSHRNGDAHSCGFRFLPDKYYWPGWDVLESFDFAWLNEHVRERLIAHPIEGVFVR